MAKATGRGSDQFNLRLPDGMRERIAHRADSSGRSMNAEIIQRLAWSFETGADSLRLELTDSLWESIERDALARDMTPHECAIEILQAAFAIDPETRSTPRQLEDKSGETEILLEEYKLLAKQRYDLLRAVCIQFFMFRDNMPPHIQVFVEQLLGDEFNPPLEEDEFPSVPKARYHQAIRTATAARERIGKIRATRRKNAIVTLWIQFEEYLEKLAFPNTNKSQRNLKSDYREAFSELLNRWKFSEEVIEGFNRVKLIKDKIFLSSGINVEDIPLPGHYEALLNDLRVSIAREMDKPRIST